MLTAVEVGLAGPVSVWELKDRISDEKEFCRPAVYRGTKGKTPLLLSKFLNKTAQEESL